MKKLLTRVLSLLVALTMLLGMAASAEVNRLSFDIDIPALDNLKLNGALAYAFDEDGCEQIILEGIYDKILLQTDGNQLVFGSEQNGFYAISQEDLSEAISTVLAQVLYGTASNEMMDIVNYLNSPAFEQDAYTAGMLLGTEANRFAAIAGSMGLVTIYENGDLQIKTTYRQLVEMVAAYLADLSTDTVAIDTFAGLEIFKVLNVPMAENAAQIPQLIANAANEVQALASQMDGGFEGSFDMFVSAEKGAMAMNMTQKQLIADGVYMEVEQHMVSDGVNVSYEQITKTGDTVYNRLSYEISDSGIVYTVESKINGVESLFNVSVGNTGLFIDVTGKENGENVALIDVDVNEAGIKGMLKGPGITGAFNFDAATGNLAFNYVENGYTTCMINATITDGYLNASYTETKNGNLQREYKIKGSGRYEFSGKWNSGNTAYEAEGTLSATASGVKLEAGIVGDTYGEKESWSIVADNNNQLGTVHAGISYKNDNKTETLSFLSARTETGASIEISYTDDSYGAVNGFSLTAKLDAEKGEFIAEGTLYDRGRELPAKLIINSELIELTFSDGNMGYRVYCENNSAGSTLDLIAGLSGHYLNDPANVMDAILATLKLDVNTLIHQFSLVMAPAATQIESAFDGNIWKADITTNGQTVTLDARMVENGNEVYLEVNGVASNGSTLQMKLGVRAVSETEVVLFFEQTIDGRTELMEARLVSGADCAYVVFSGVIPDVDTVSVGAKAIGENTVQFFFEASLGAETAGFYLPVTYVEEMDKATLTAELYEQMNGNKTVYGAVNLMLETLAERPAHMTGTPITAEMMVQMLMGLIG